MPVSLTMTLAPFFGFVVIVTEAGSSWPARPVLGSGSQSLAITLIATEVFLRMDAESGTATGGVFTPDVDLVVSVAGCAPGKPRLSGRGAH